MLQQTPTVAAAAVAVGVDAPAAVTAAAAADRALKGGEDLAAVLGMGQQAGAPAAAVKLLADLGVLQRKWARELAEVGDTCMIDEHE
jgi:hypothetical protein